MVVGDPAGMRTLASRLAKDAGQLRDAASDVKAAVRKMDASGEWADACQRVVEAQARQFAAAASRLDGLAATLRRSATQVEAEIRAEAEAQRRREAAAAAAAEAARRAAVQRAEDARRRS